MARAIPGTTFHSHHATELASAELYTALAEAETLVDLAVGKPEVR